MATGRWTSSAHSSIPTRTAWPCSMATAAARGIRMQRFHWLTVPGPAIAADMNGDGINDLIVEEADCNNNSQQGNAYITLLTRNRNSTYNPEQLVHTSHFVNNIAAIRADRNTRPD